jgi:uncharacterized protein with ParB-like and HNH nuclease domain
MMPKKQIEKLLEDIKTSYLVGYFKGNLTMESEKWGQIQILEWVLSK